ncbi:hypothetical protein J6590_046083 [Homalodisca vitripennis]|nr:hypothetical protein J6590_046083 [Homalodisca vitripennis]
MINEQQEVSSQGVPITISSSFPRARAGLSSVANYRSPTPWIGKKKIEVRIIETIGFHFHLGKEMSEYAECVWDDCHINIHC